MLANKEGKIGRALAGGHLPSLAKSIVSHNELRELVFLQFLDEINAECTTLCQLKPQPSLFRKIPSSMYDNFTWKVLIDDLKGRAPNFFRVLSTVASHNDHHNKKKQAMLTIQGFPWQLRLS